MKHLIFSLLLSSCHGLVPDPSWLKFCGELESPTNQMPSHPNPSISHPITFISRSRRSASSSHRRSPRFVTTEEVGLPRFVAEMNTNCSDVDCLVQRAMGLGFLGLSAVIAIWTVLRNPDSAHLTKRRKRRSAEDQSKCAFLLLEEDLIFTSISCLPRALKTGITIGGINYTIDSVKVVENDNTALVKLGKQIIEGVLDCHLSPITFKY